MSYASDSAAAGVNDTELLVLAKSDHLGTIVVPLHGLDDTAVAGDGGLAVTGLDVPDLDVVVLASSGDDILSNRVEANGADFALVALEGLSSLLAVLLEASLRDDPHLGVAVLRGSGEDIVVERVEVEVKNGALVASKEGDSVVATEITDLHAAHSSTTSDLPGDGNPLGVGNDEVGIPGLLGELDTLVDSITLGGGSKHVAELGGTNKLRHINGRESGSERGQERGDEMVPNRVPPKSHSDCF